MNYLNANWTKKLGPKAPEFEEALGNMMEMLDEILDVRFNDEHGSFGSWQKPLIKLEFGSKYCRIVRYGNPDAVSSSGMRASSQQMCSGFIGLDGSLYMCASWKKPALNGARGNIFDADFGFSAFNDMGTVRYK